MKSSVKTTNLERLLILHLGLAPIAPDESASIEELSEYILYYHDVERGQISIDARYNFEDAVRFASLASSFYSIQSTIDAQMQTQSSELPYTTKVILTTCIMVFIPLEHVEGLLAVAQLSLRTNENDSNFLSFTPSDIRGKVLNAHNKFRNLNGSGIHSQLFISIGNAQLGSDATHDTFHFQQGMICNTSQEPASYMSDVKRIPNTESNLKQSSMTISKCSIEEFRGKLKNFFDAFIRDLGVEERL